MNKLLLVMAILVAALVSNAAALSGTSLGKDWSITVGDALGNSANAYAYTTSGTLDESLSGIYDYSPTLSGDITCFNGDAGAGVSATNQWGDTAYSDAELTGTGTVANDQSASAKSNSAVSSQDTEIQLKGQGSAKTVTGASTDRFGVKGQSEVSASIDQPAPVGFGYLVADQDATAGTNIGGRNTEDTGDIYGGSIAAQSVDADAFTNDADYTASATAIAHSADAYGYTSTAAYVENGYMGSQPVADDHAASGYVPGTSYIPGTHKSYDSSIFQAAGTSTDLDGISGVVYRHGTPVGSWDPSVSTGSFVYGNYEATYKQGRTLVTVPLLAGDYASVSTYVKNDITGFTGLEMGASSGSLGTSSFALQDTDIVKGEGFGFANIDGLDSIHLPMPS